MEELYQRIKDLKEEIEHVNSVFADDRMAYELQIRDLEEKLAKTITRYQREGVLRRYAEKVEPGTYVGTNKYGAELIIKVEDYVEKTYGGTKVQKWHVCTPRAVTWTEIYADEIKLGVKIDI
jgi:hypothetical protein